MTFPPDDIYSLCNEYLTQSARVVWGAKDEEIDVHTFHFAAVALKDAPSGRVVAEGRVVVEGDQGRLVALRVHHRRREVETVSSVQHGRHGQTVVDCTRQLDFKAKRFVGFRCCDLLTGGVVQVSDVRHAVIVAISAHVDHRWIKHYKNVRPIVQARSTSDKFQVSKQLLLKHCILKEIKVLQ